MVQVASDGEKGKWPGGQSECEWGSGFIGPMGSALGSWGSTSGRYPPPPLLLTQWPCCFRGSGTMGQLHSLGLNNSAHCFQMLSSFSLRRALKN